MKLKSAKSGCFSKFACQLAVIFLCSQLITGQEITARDFPESLSSNETQIRIKRGQKQSGIPVGSIPMNELLKDYPVGTRLLTGTGSFPTANEWNLFKLDYDSNFDVFLLKLVPNAAISGLPKTDESYMQGYWLVTASLEEETITFNGKTKHQNNVLKVPNQESTKIVFTAEFQSCSMYAKVNSDSVEFFHHNRQTLHSLYVNEYNGKPISKINFNFLDNNGYGIIFNDNPRLNPRRLYSATNSEIRPVGGVIAITEPLYIKDEDNGELVKINTIKGTNDERGASKNVDSLIRLNRVAINHQNDLQRKYDVVIRWEDYMGLPANYELLMSRDIIKRQFVTGYLHRKDTNSNWHFYSQRITYYNAMKDMTKDDAKMFNIANPHHLDVEIRR